MKKTKTEAQQTRQQLLDAALEVFWREGVTRASLQQIAAEAGLTRGALYWHFKNKEELFETLLAQKNQPFDQRLNEAALRKSGDVLTYLRQSFLELFRILESDVAQRKLCEVMHLKCERTAANQIITETAMRYQRLMRSQAITALELSRSQGTLPEKTDMELASIYLESTLIGLVYTWIDQPERFALSAAAESVLDTAFQALQSGRFNRAP